VVKNLSLTQLLTVWNRLPLYVRLSLNIDYTYIKDTCKDCLETHLFTQSINNSAHLATTNTTDSVWLLRLINVSLLLYASAKRHCYTPCVCLWVCAVTENKFVQNNLERGPRRAAVAHIHRKVPISYNGAPQIRPKSTPSRGPIPKPHYLPHPSTRPTHNAKPHPDPIPRFATMHWTDRPTDRRTYVYGPTDRQIVHGKVWRL